MKSRRIRLDKQNVFLFQDAVLVHMFKVANENDKKQVYVGTIMIPWKECIEKEQNGESPEMQFQLELIQWEDLMSEYEVNGLVTGQLQWVKYGHKNSRYQADGQAKPREEKAKGADDFKGKRAGAGGSLQIIPRKLDTRLKLDLKKKICVKFTLLNKSGKQVDYVIT